MAETQRLPNRLLIPLTSSTIILAACLALYGKASTAQSPSLISTMGVDCGYAHNTVSPSLTGLSSTARIDCSEKTRTLTGNAIPDHAVGVFPRPGNPNTITAQNVRVTMPLAPQSATSAQRRMVPGYLRNSIKLEPETAETYGNVQRPGSGPPVDGWRYEAIQDALNLGLDENLAHVQPNGAYHYHGMPEGYLTKLWKGKGNDNGKAMTLVGWAVDGFPIYARYGLSSPQDPKSAVQVMRPNYRLKTAAEINATTVNGQARPATTGFEDRGRGGYAKSLPLGVFVQDWVFDPALGGDLDECNGRFSATPEFPQGIYHYYITDAYPYIQRCIKGQAEEERRPGPGAGAGGFGRPGGMGAGMPPRPPRPF